MPPRTKNRPNQVCLSITFLSTYHSPKTVNRNAIEFVIGTVNDNSTGSYGIISD